MQSDADDADVLVVGLQLCAVGFQYHALRLACGLYALGLHAATSAVVAARLYVARLIDGLPTQVAVLRHLLSAQSFSICDKFHLGTVGVGPYVYLLALVAFKVPVGQQVQHGFAGPPCLQIVSLVLGESAVVENAKFRPCGRELQRVGFAAIVEARPVEQSAEPRALVVELPTAFNAVQQAVGTLRAAVDGFHATVVGIVVVDAARAAAGGLLAAQRDALRIAGAVLLHGILQDVVIACHVHRLYDSGTAAGGGTGQTGGVQAVAELAHGGTDAASVVVPLDAPLLVAHAPEDDRRMVAVAANHLAELVPLVVVDAREAVLLQHEHAQSVAGIQQFGCGGIMTGADGIAAERLQLAQRPLLHGIGHGNTHAGVVLVHVHSQQLHRFAVEEEAPVGIEAQLAQTGGGEVFVDLTASFVDHLRAHLI